MANSIGEGTTLEMYQTETRTFTFTITDDNGDARDLSSKTLRLVIHDSNSPPTYKGKVENDAMDKTQAASGIVGVPVAAPLSDTATTEYHYELWNIDDLEVLQHGSFRIKPAVQNAS